MTSTLPYDVLGLIFQYLSEEDRVNAIPRVCVAWRARFAPTHRPGIVQRVAWHDTDNRVVFLVTDRFRILAVRLHTPHACLLTVTKYRRGSHCIKQFFHHRGRLFFVFTKHAEYTPVDDTMLFTHRHERVPVRYAPPFYRHRARKLLPIEGRDAVFVISRAANVIGISEFRWAADDDSPVPQPFTTSAPGPFAASYSNETLVLATAATTVLLNSRLQVLRHVSCYHSEVSMPTQVHYLHDLDAILFYKSVHDHTSKMISLSTNQVLFSTKLDCLGPSGHCLTFDNQYTQVAKLTKEGIRFPEARFTLDRGNSAEFLADDGMGIFLFNKKHSEFWRVKSPGGTSLVAQHRADGSWPKAFLNNTSTRVLVSSRERLVYYTFHGQVVSTFEK